MYTRYNTDRPSQRNTALRPTQRQPVTLRTVPNQHYSQPYSSSRHRDRDRDRDRAPDTSRLWRRRQFEAYLSQPSQHQRSHTQPINDRLYNRQPISTSPLAQPANNNNDDLSGNWLFARRQPYQQDPYPRLPSSGISIIPADNMRSQYYGYTNEPYFGYNQSTAPINLAYYNPGTTYRVYNQPAPPRRRYYKRSRTAPARLVRSGPKYYKVDGGLQGGASTIAPSVLNYDDRYRSFSGPVKYPRPVYYKGSGTTHRRQTYPANAYPSQYHTLPSQPQAYGPPPAESFYGTATRYRNRDFDRSPPRYRQAYAPSAVTGYAPSQPAYRSSFGRSYPYAARGSTQYAITKYPLFLRYIMKIAQVIVGVLVIVFLTAPTWPHGLLQFLSRTASQGQFLVLGLILAAAFISFCLLLTIQTAHEYRTWRNTDASLSAIMSVVVFVAAAIEAWYAACYPPYGSAYSEACGLWQWGVATILAFIDLVLYAVDVAFAFRSGVSVL